MFGVAARCKILVVEASKDTGMPNRLVLGVCRKGDISL